MKGKLTPITTTSITPGKEHAATIAAPYSVQVTPVGSKEPTPALSAQTTPPGPPLPSPKQEKHFIKAGKKIFENTIDFESLSREDAGILEFAPEQATPAVSRESTPAGSSKQDESPPFLKDLDSFVFFMPSPESPDQSESTPRNSCGPKSKPLPERNNDAGVIISFPHASTDYDSNSSTPVRVGGSAYMENLEEFNNWVEYNEVQLSIERGEAYKVGTTGDVDPTPASI